MKVTDDQIIAALQEQGSQRKAAAALGITRSTLQERVKRLPIRGYSPAHDMTHAVPEPYVVKGVSTLYRDDGTVAAQWVKSVIDRERARKLVEEALAAAAESIPREKPRSFSGHSCADLLNVFVLTDYHLGMLSWGEETGEDWDIGIAENLLVSLFSTQIAMAPAADVAILAQLGDFLHTDGLEAITPTNGHQLDADTRFAKIVRIAIRALRRVIGLLLEKHPRVHIINAEGNHDLASSIWLREMLSALYEDEPRVTVDRNPDPYYCYEWGKTSLFFHHGHIRKPASIDDVFAAKFREVFGRTKYSYAHMGHLHSVDVKETNLMLVEQHRTLAAKDAYASRGGWISGRDAKCITYSKEFGEVSRLTVNPELIASRIAE